jgi:outer membrane receptor for ferrienterochelin and colicins
MIALVNVPVGEIPAGVTTAYMGDGSNNVQARMYKNMDDARTCGVDVTLGYQFTKELSMTAAYSYLDTEAHLYDADTDQMKTVVIDGMAHHKWNASVMYNHAFSKSYKLGVNLSTRSSSKRYYENNGNGKGYQIWRINTTHDFGRSGKMLAYRLELGVDNIFNYVDRTMHPYHLGTNTPGRTVHATLTIKFNYGKRVKQHNLSTKQNSNNDEND